MRQREGELLVKVAQRRAGRPLWLGSTSCAAVRFQTVKGVMVRSISWIMNATDACGRRDQWWLEFLAGA